MARVDTYSADINFIVLYCVYLLRKHIQSFNAMENISYEAFSIYINEFLFKGSIS